MIIPVKTNSHGYDIVVKKGVLDNLKNYLNTSKKAMIITDSGVPKIYSEKVKNAFENAYIFTIKKGEKSKNFKNYKKILEKMVELGFERKDCVIAVGGGVVGDLSGFVASSYMRGVEFYNIPTTLLSQIDSSIGGKVAINFSKVKNVVGAFYQPSKVIIDSEVLKTLPKRLLNEGICEGIKMASTSSEELFEFFEKQEITEENIDKVIVDSLSIKKQVVEEDPLEKGLRKVLNFGHTLGHCLESYYMGKLYHGECVGLGMLTMCSKEVKERLIKVLQKFNIETSLKNSKIDVEKYLKHDKKINNGKITCVYVDKIGSFEFVDYSLSKIKEKMGEILWKTPLVKV